MQHTSLQIAERNPDRQQSNIVVEVWPTLTVDQDVVGSAALEVKSVLYFFCKEYGEFPFLQKCILQQTAHAFIVQE
jgi:hypothetical protein